MERQKFFLRISVVDEQGNPVVQSEDRPILLQREFAEARLYPAHVGNFYASLVGFCTMASHAVQMVDGLTAFSRSNFDPRQPAHARWKARVDDALGVIAWTVEAAHAAKGE